jgi:glutaredoxin
MRKTFFTLLFLIGFIQLSFSQETQKKSIIVYGSDECHHCIDTKAFLNKNNIEFTFFDIDKNPEALKEMLSKLKKANISTSNLGIPVVDKNGIIYINNEVFEDFLNKLK